MNDPCFNLPVSKLNFPPTPFLRLKPSPMPFFFLSFCTMHLNKNLSNIRKGQKETTSLPITNNYSYNQESDVSGKWKWAWVSNNSRNLSLSVCIRPVYCYWPKQVQCLFCAIRFSDTFNIKVNKQTTSALAAGIHQRDGVDHDSFRKKSATSITTGQEQTSMFRGTTALWSDTFTFYHLITMNSNLHSYHYYISHYTP